MGVPGFEWIESERICLFIWKIACKLSENCLGLGDEGDLSSREEELIVEALELEAADAVLGGGEQGATAAAAPSAGDGGVGSREYEEEEAV